MAPRLRPATRLRADAILLLGRVASSVVGSVLMIRDLNLASAQLLELAQIVEQIESRLHVDSPARWG